MSSVARGVVEALKTTIAGIDGSGSYTYDLSGTDMVQISTIPASPPAPRAYIMSPRLSSSPDGVCLGHYARTLSIAVVGVVSEGSGEARLLAALDLLEDFARALESERTLGDRVYDLTITGTDVLDGEELHLSGYGVCGIALELTWSERGVGA